MNDLCLRASPLNVETQFTQSRNWTTRKGHPTAQYTTAMLARRVAENKKSATGKEKGFVRLFDGKSLRGWEGNLKAFRVEKGAIVAGSLKKKIPNNEFLCTKKKFKDFELRLDVRLIGRGKNAGIQFRSARIPNHHEVKGYQADVGSMGKKSIWGALYDESRRGRFLAQGDNAKLQKTVRTGKWNAMVIRCKGNRIEIWVNKVKTVDYTEKQANIPKNGIIGLQIHGGPPAEAWYKNIRIKQL